MLSATLSHRVAAAFQRKTGLTLDADARFGLYASLMSSKAKTFDELPANVRKFVLTAEGDDSKSLLAAARSDKTDGAMIALVPTDADAERLAVPGFEPPDELHLTLWYLGDAVDVSDEQLEELIVGALEAVGDWNPIEGNAFGAALWNPKSDYPAWVLNVGDARTAETEGGDPPYLAMLRDEIGEFIPFDVPKQHTPWQPHICLAYSSGDLANQLISRLGPVTFDRVRIAVGENVIDIPLGDDELVAGAAFHLKGEHDQSTHGHGGGGGDGKSGGKSLKAGKPLKVTHVLIHKKHEPGTTIAVTKGGQSRLLWTGSQYNIEEKTPSGDWKVQESTKKSKTYQKLQELGVDWYEPEVDDSGDGDDSSASAPPTPKPVDDKSSTPSGATSGVKPIKMKSLSGLKQSGYGPLGGQKYQDDAGNSWEVDLHKTDTNARSEVLANRLYSLAGVDVPDAELVDMNEANPKFVKSGRTLATIASRPDGTAATGQMLDNADFVAKVQRDFAIDAWLGNETIVGVQPSNFTVKSDGSVTRLNMKSTLLYLQNGKPKGDFGSSVTEIDSMRDPNTATGYTAKLYNSITEQQVRDGVKRIAAIKPEQIDALVDDAGFTGKDATDLKRVLKARREDLIKRFGDDAPPGTLNYVTPIDPPLATAPAIGDSGVGPDSDDNPDNDTALSVQPIETKSLSGLKKVSNGPFTIPNGKYKDSDGTSSVVVAHASDDRARNEVLANRLYELSGTNVTTVNFVKLSEVDFPHSGETLGTIANSPDGTTDVLQKLNNATIKQQLHENFAVDAWLGNWDVVGLGGTNISLDSENNVTRLSAHGSLLYRAQGQPKGAAFSDTVSEIDTLRDPNTNPNSAAVFKDVTEDQIRAGVKKIAAIHPEQIDTLVDDAGFTGETADKLKKTLKARRQDLIKRFGPNAPAGGLKPMAAPSPPAPPPPPTPTPTAPVSTPTPPGPATPSAPSGPKIYSVAEKTQVQKIFANNNVKWHNDTKKIYDSALEVSKKYPGLTMGDALDIMDQSLQKKTGNPFRTKVEKFLKTNAGKQYALAQGGPGGIGTTSPATSSPVAGPSAPSTVVSTNPNDYMNLTASQASVMQSQMDQQTPPPWTQTQRAALKYYTGSAYTEINKCLRGTGVCTPALLGRIKSIQKAMKPSTRDIVIYRKTNAATFGLATAAGLDDMVGKVIKDDGVMSTSIHQGTWSGSIQMIIEAPKGSKMAWVAPISHYPQENEIMVAPGTHFEIISVTPNGTGRTIRIRIIPGSDSA